MSYVKAVALILTIVLVFPITHYTSAETGECILAVMEFDDPSSDYVWESFTNYFDHGDIMKLRGYVMLTNSWNGLVDIPVNMFIKNPAGTTVIQKELKTNDKGIFEFSFPITDDFEVGKYIATVEASKEGYQKVENEYLTIFYVLRTHDYSIDVNEQEYIVRTGSINYDALNMKFDEERWALSFDLKKVEGNYAVDSDLGYINSYLFLTIEKSLIEGSFFSEVNGVGPGWDSWNVNATHTAVQINMSDIADGSRITVGTNEMSKM